MALRNSASKSSTVGSLSLSPSGSVARSPICDTPIGLAMPGRAYSTTVLSFDFQSRMPIVGWSTAGSRMRAECLNENWFMSLDDARQKVEAWRHHNNEEPPHSALDSLSLREFVASRAQICPAG